MSADPAELGRRLRERDRSAAAAALNVIEDRSPAGRARTTELLAVDASSKRSGGALLGDRVRIEHDPKDDGVLIRSTAAGGRLGGLAVATREAVDALAPVFDIVVVETVGVGQSETDVEEVCDTVAVGGQPPPRDGLQFLE